MTTTPATLKERLDRHFDPTDANAGADAGYGALRLMKIMARTLGYLPPGHAQAATIEMRRLAEKLHLFSYDEDDEGDKETFEQFLEKLAAEQP